MGGEPDGVIVADLGDRYQFVTQPDHAALAGQFADHWGNERVDRPAPFAPLVVAAYTHDTGWADYDRHPRLDEAGTPVDFREMPADVWTPLYADGVEAVVETDTYAGLLVSMHGAGLRNQRYGLSPEWPATPPAFREFVDSEANRQERLLETALTEPGTPASPADRELLSDLHRDNSVPEGYDGRLWDDYRRLQAWDTLSLAFCVTDAPPGYDDVSDVPATSGETVTLSVTRVGDGEFTVDPYPFATAPLTVTVPVRTVAADAFDDERALARAYYAAGRETRQVTLLRV